MLWGSLKDSLDEDEDDAPAEFALCLSSGQKLDCMTDDCWCH